VVAEVKRVVGTDEKQEFTFATLDQLVYTEQVIHETMRYETIVPLIMRTATEEDTISGYHIPKGTRIFWNVEQSHSNSRHWEHADRFDPDHFAPERRVSRTNFNPFGNGVRMCPGMSVAMIEMKTLLAILLPRFVFRHAPGHERMQFEWAVVMQPKNMMQLMTIQPRA